MILQASLIFLSLMGYALDAPMAPQVQQANPGFQNTPNFGTQLGPGNFPQYTSGISVYTVIGIIFALGAFIFSMIIIGRWRNMELAYVGRGRRISGRYRIFIWGQGWIDCRVTEVPEEEIEEKLDIIKQIEVIKKKQNLVLAVDDIIKKVKTGALFLYEIKVISRRNMRLRGNLGYSMMLSSGAIDDKDFYYEAQQGVLAPFSPSWREKPRIVQCLASSQVYLDVETAERDYTTCYVIAPWSDPSRHQGKTQNALNLEEWEINPVNVEVKAMQLPQALMEIMLIMRTVADSYKSNRSQYVKAKTMEEMNNSLSDQLVHSSIARDFYKSKIGERELIKLGEKLVKREMAEGWIFFFMAVMFGFVAIELPTWVPQWSQVNPALLLCVFEAFVGIIKVATQKKKETPYEKMKSQYASVESGSESSM